MKNSFELINYPVLNKMVAKVFTDDFIVFIETNEGDAIEHSPNASISDGGQTHFGIFYLTNAQWEETKRDFNVEGVLLKEISDFDY